MQILSKDNTEMMRQLFCILNVGSEGSVAQTIVVQEGV